jgi:hypothetical protein
MLVTVRLSLVMFWCRKRYLQSVLVTAEGNPSALVFQIGDQWRNDLQLELLQVVSGSTMPNEMV